MKKELTLEDSYNYLLTNTADFQSFTEDERLDKAIEFLGELRKLEEYCLDHLKPSRLVASVDEINFCGVCGVMNTDIELGINDNKCLNCDTEFERKS